MEAREVAANFEQLRVAFAAVPSTAAIRVAVSLELPADMDFSFDELVLRVELRGHEDARAMLRLDPRGARIEAFCAGAGGFGYSHFRDTLNVRIAGGFRWGPTKFDSAGSLAAALLELLRVRLDEVQLLARRARGATLAPGLA